MRDRLLNQLVTFVAIVVMVLVIGLGSKAPSLASAQQLTPCGQGVVIRPTNAIVIDKWTAWVAPIGPPASAPSTNPNTAPPLLTHVDAPSRVIFGADIGGEIPICVETADTMKCVPLAKVRELTK